MKATEILGKRLVISNDYGCDTFQIVDFEIVKDFMRLYYDSHYNDEAHIYAVTFPIDDIERMLSGDEVRVVTATYRLI